MQQILTTIEVAEMNTCWSFTPMQAPIGDHIIVVSAITCPQCSTRHEIVRRARAMFADTPSVDVIVSRAHAVILDTIGARLAKRQPDKDRSTDNARTESDKNRHRRTLPALAN